MRLVRPSSCPESAIFALSPRRWKPLAPAARARWHQAFLDPIILIDWMILAMYGYTAYVMRQLYGCRLFDGKSSRGSGRATGGDIWT